MRSAPADTRSSTVIAGTAQSTGAASGTGFTVSRTAVGVYIVRFLGALKAIRSVHVSTLGASGAFQAATIVDADTVQVNMWATNSAAQDTAFLITVVGVPR